MSREEKLALLPNEKGGVDDQKSMTRVVDIKSTREPIRLPTDVRHLIATFLDPLSDYSLRHALWSIPNEISRTFDTLAALALHIQFLDLATFPDLRSVIEPLIEVIKKQLRLNERENIEDWLGNQLTNFVSVALLDKQESYQKSALYKTEIENQPHKNLVRRIRNVSELADDFLHSLPHFLIKDEKKQLWVGPCQLGSAYASWWRNLTSIFYVRLNRSQNDFSPDFFDVGFENTLRTLMCAYENRYYKGCCSRSNFPAISRGLLGVAFLIGASLIVAYGVSLPEKIFLPTLLTLSLMVSCDGMTSPLNQNVGGFMRVFIRLTGLALVIPTIAFAIYSTNKDKDAAEVLAVALLGVMGVLTLVIGFLALQKSSCQSTLSNKPVRLFYMEIPAFADLVKSPEALKVAKKDAIDLEKIERLSAFWRLAKEDKKEKLAALLNTNQREDLDAPSSI